MSELLTPANMAWLSDNYQIGIGVMTGVIAVLYIVFSLMIILRAKKYNVGMAVTGMIPVVNIFVYFIATHKTKKQMKLERFRNSVDMDGELKL